MSAQPIFLAMQSGSNRSPIAAQLKRELRGDVLFGQADRGRYATDASIYQIMPIGVVVPRAWDRFALALPFTRVHVALGSPIEPDATEDARADVERALVRLNAEIAE